MTDSIYLKEMGKKIRAVRKAKGISMRKMITLCSLHKSSISEIENGKWNSRILTLKMLAETMDVDVKDFL